ncbi:valine--tRNA ligase [Lactobacillus sp. W8089]|nr:valine--tRNA ligase [Lactobacillus sp. W8086]MBI0108815.1 valine--tRNA ligase [Lactobacillus sp. W8085]MBI0112032.1 valine--tRNA ligase [Lactobacillus sp. W8088]MBI0115748.1 valine--tRNA ligase [Lactobacillus sp. W8087]MBI0119472.1 valine--tRNA ligase [Lactobacillus sp. W8089]MBI0131438.1 valine--tRNA ligase [Lactobacillus sp. W8090]
MTTQSEMSTKYDHQAVEAGRYQKWLEQDLFKPNGNPEAKPYSIVIPPPNVTGKLHLGHAWDTTIQDILIRQKRMQGYDTLYLPGMDHAGIATQAKVEARLQKEGKTRFDLGREAFVQEVWRWKDEYAKIIHQQWAKMGLSLDYSRERFTLDAGLSKAVRKVFVDLYQQGLIYRGEYIINWDPELQTALSDIEVEHQDDQGAFYHIKYPLADGSGAVEIATTRPETMPGDVAIAVYPGDERYQDIVGKEAILPLFGRKLPIIEDHYVDPKFGTGLVKITPAHDPNDFNVGNRHNLQRINVMNPDGTMNDKAGKYQGMDRFAARKAIVRDLKAEGYLIKEEAIVHSVGHSERSGVQVEPRLSTQWFVKMKPLAEMTLKNQKTDQKVHFVPERFEHTFDQWMENVHDWVISRQLWWGHRIPAWYNKQTGEMYVGEEAPQDIANWEQDPDVLDTWFSSALWPFSTLGWPDKNSKDFKRYFPTNALVTGYDIIFFWVARMMFQSIEFTHQRPFKSVILHGLMRDEQGRKMSKSLGNGIDPMEVIDKYGVDALRWFLVTGSAPGQDARFSYEKVGAAWNFINKIWNASRFVIMNLADTPAPTTIPTDLDLADQWILAQLNTTVADVLRLSEKYELGEVGRALYNFIWNDFCDWYIEFSKAVLNGDDEAAKKHKRQVLAYVLDQILRLLHPIMPFVTEKIWLTMPHEGKSLVVAEYPQVHEQLANTQAVAQMRILIMAIKGIRQMRADAHAPLSNPIDILIKTQNSSVQQILIANQEYLEQMAHPKSLQISPTVSAPKLALTAVIDGAQIFVPLAELVDITSEIQRQEKELTKLQKDIDFVNNKLNNPGFVKNAPQKLVEQQRTKLDSYKNRRDQIKARISELKQN